MLQIPIAEASNRLFEYGLSGVLVVVFGFIVWKLYMKLDAEAKTWQKMALDLNKSQVEILVKQNETNNRLLDVQKKANAQTLEFYKRMEKGIEEMPTKVAKEVILVKATPAG